MAQRLTDTAIRNAIRSTRGAAKPRKLFDDKGLFVLVSPNGSALWRLKYVFESREKSISFGSYADVSLKRARERRDEARALVADNIDPSARRKAEKHAHATTVAAVAKEWLSKQDVEPATVRRQLRRLEKYIFPHLGNRPIGTVKAPELLAALRKIEASDKLYSAKKVRELCGAVWRFAIATGRAERDISADLRGALSSPESQNHPSITEPKRVGELLRSIDSYTGQATTAAALRLAPLVFVRPGELRRAEWSEIELDSTQPIWRIPAEKMKMRDAHVVPLSKQAVAILRGLVPHTGDGSFVFPSLRGGSRPMSENTVNAALRRLGYSGAEHVGHGFRSMASTMLNELGWNTDLIELQLAHKERNKSRGAYNKALRIDERRKMLQSWADHLDSLRAGDEKVVAIGKRAKASA